MDSSISWVKFIAHRRQNDGEVQSLQKHLEAVGRLSARHASKIRCGANKDGQSIDLASAGELIGLLHDFGKYSKSFQDYLGSAVGLIDQDADNFVDAEHLRGQIDHSTAGAQLIWQTLSKQDSIGMLCAQMLALCVVSHHSGLIDCIAPDGTDVFTRRMRKAEADAHLQECLSQADASVMARVTELFEGEQLFGNLQAVLQNIMQLEQQHGASRPILQFKIGLLLRFLFSCLIDADRVDTIDFEFLPARRARYLGQYVGWPKLIRRLENHLDSLPGASPIDQLRRDVADHCRTAAERERGFFTLTVPTGGGKTLASLRFGLHHAHKHDLDRVVFVIPFTSIIDQNADVARRVLEPVQEGVEPGSVVLEHHSNLTPEEQTWRAKVLSENWDAPIVYTTSVQLLEALFGAGTRGARRMHQLANAVIVFDEAQTLPVRCIHLFNNAINFLVEQCGSSVVLCTATQPLLNAVDPRKGAARFSPGDEIIPNVGELFDALKRTELLPHYRPGGWTDDEVADLAAAEVKESGSCLVIVNTRKAALSLYQACKRAAEYPVYHLSTSMCPAHRRQVLAAIRQRLAEGAPTLCISTQLIEAGVDVDFGTVIRHVAGLDSIAQAAGRCNRNGRHATGRVHVINPAQERIDKLTDIRIGRDVTLRLLAEFDGDLLSPSAMETYFSHYFFQRAGEMTYAVSSDDALRDDKMLNLLSDNLLAVGAYGDNQGGPPPLVLRQAFMTAANAFRSIDAPTQGIIVPYGDEGHELVARLRDDGDAASRPMLLKRAQQFSVNLFRHEFERLLQDRLVNEIFAGTGVFCICAEHYSLEFGLSAEPVIPMESKYA